MHRPYYHYKRAAALPLDHLAPVSGTAALATIGAGLTGLAIRDEIKFRKVLKHIKAERLARRRKARQLTLLGALSVPAGIVAGKYYHKSRNQ